MPGDTVRIVNTSDKVLDGMVCVVAGFTARYHNNDYAIITLPQAVWVPSYNSHVTAMQMTDSCLEVVDRKVS